MNDPETGPDAGGEAPDRPGLDGWLAREAERERLEEELRPANKAKLFDILTAAGVACVAVTFDGGGDSGQIESVDARDAHGDVALPEVHVELASVVWDGAAHVEQRAAMTLAAAVEQLAWDCLESRHDGWENNEGGYGEFTFDVATGSITLVYNERYIETETFEHAW